MKGYIPKEKMSKKAQKAINNQRRQTWTTDPRPRIVESRKTYNRKGKTSGESCEYSSEDLFPCVQTITDFIALTVSAIAFFISFPFSRSVCPSCAGYYFYRMPGYH